MDQTHHFTILCVLLQSLSNRGLTATMCVWYDKAQQSADQIRVKQSCSGVSEMKAFGCLLKNKTKQHCFPCTHKIMGCVQIVFFF